MRPTTNQILEELEKAKTKLTIVEGKEDKKVLKNLGFRKIITMQQPFYKVIEKINKEEVVILTDLDKKGKELYSKIQHELNKRGIKIDNKLRHLLFRTGLSHIEGLDNFLKNREEAQQQY